jgi:isopenicillin-N N-acyltransferase-like protein
MLAAPPSEVIDLEVSPHTHGTVEARAGVLVHANHFTTDAVEDPNLEDRLGSVTRQGQLSQLLASGTVDLAGIQHFLRDTDHAPDALCRYPDPAKPEHEGYTTVVSVVMNLSERILYISDGPPDKSPYQRFALAGGEA